MDVETPEGPLEEVSCYQDEIEVQVYNFLQDVPAMLGQTSGQDLWYFVQYVKQYFLDIVFMEHGPMVGRLALHQTFGIASNARQRGLQSGARLRACPCV